MGNLSNLYISQSYISLLHLGSDNTASSTLTPIQDGLGNSIGISVNNAGDVTLAGTLGIRRGLDITGSVTINTAVTASTPSYVNSGNQFTNNIVRITGSFASGSQQQPTVNEVQIGWPVYGPGLVSGAVVTNKNYINSQFVELTVNQNTIQWFGNYYFTNPNVQYYNFSVSGSEDITGSLWVRDDLTVNDISASGNISASNLSVRGRISAYELDVTIESSSVIFTSGSNILGDEANVDTQTLIGRVIVSGSLEVTSSIKATSDISSSTISGIGNVTLYSQSVDNRLDLLENFSSSQYKADSSSFDSRIDSLEAFSSSLVVTFVTQAELNLSSSQLQSNINTKLDTSSFNSYTSSLSSSTSLTSASFNSRINTIVASSATTGSNTFVGNQIITGSLILSSSAAVELSVIGNQVITGSLRGNVNTLSVVSQTASMDCSLGNFFTITVPSSSTTLLTATNIQPGETIQLRVQQGATTGSLVLSSNFSLPTGSVYQAINSPNKSDILSFVSFDTTTLYSVFVKAF